MQAIYSITHTESGRRYVGSTVNIYRRRREHRHRLLRGEHPAKHLSNAFAKYGEDAFVMRILEMPVLGDLHQREQAWIDLLRPEFNVAPVAGSVLGLKHTDATKQTMSQAQKLSYAERGGSPLKNRPRTEEAKASISAGKKGKPHAPEHLANLSRALKGRVSPRKGVTLSAETRARISVSKTGKKQTPESIVKRIQANTGKVRTPEQRKRISDAKKGKKFTEDHCKSLALAARSRIDRA